MHFGRKSEKLAREIEGLELRLEDLSAGSGVADVQHAKVRREKPATGGESAAREPLPPHLPREDRVLNRIRSAPSATAPRRASARTSPNSSPASRRRSR
nr:transposase [Burkholderia sp. Tr-862]